METKFPSEQSAIFCISERIHNTNKGENMEKNQVVYYHSFSGKDNAEERMEKMEKLYEKKRGNCPGSLFSPLA